ncbi:polyphosphate kinase 1, partial [Pseudomonas aeruginosa]
LESHPELQYPPITPAIPRILQKKENHFNVRNKLDVLLMSPFEPYTPMFDLLRQAAMAPNLPPNKQTPYSSGANTEIVDSMAG